jgi:Homeodomain-like domain-containing protein
VAKNLSEAVQQLLARVLLESKTASQGAEAATEARGGSLLPIEEWRPAQEESVKQTIATRRAERQDRYQQVLALWEQGLTSQEIAGRLGMKARTVREWLSKGVAPNSRPRRKYRSEFDPYAPYVLKRWQEGEHSGRQLWREVRFQGYRGLSFVKMLGRILPKAWPQSTSTTLLMRVQWLTVPGRVRGERHAMLLGILVAARSEDLKAEPVHAVSLV